MIELRDNTLYVGVPLTMERASAATESGLKALGKIRSGQEVVIDLSGLIEADSSALAALLAWQRAVALSGGSVRIQQAPAGLQSIARVYGAESLLPGLVAA